MAQQISHNTRLFDGGFVQDTPERADFDGEFLEETVHHIEDNLAAINGRLGELTGELAQVCSAGLARIGNMAPQRAEVVDLTTRLESYGQFILLNHDFSENNNVHTLVRLSA